MAARFDGKVFNFTQPDGSPIQLRGWGDQHYAVFETIDGYTVTKNPATGYWEVARLSADGNVLEASSDHRRAPGWSSRRRPPRSSYTARERAGHGT